MQCIGRYLNHLQIKGDCSANVSVEEHRVQHYAIPASWVLTRFTRFPVSISVYSLIPLLRSKPFLPTVPQLNPPTFKRTRRMEWEWKRERGISLDVRNALHDTADFTFFFPFFFVFFSLFSPLSNFSLTATLSSPLERQDEGGKRLGNGNKILFSSLDLTIDLFALTRQTSPASFLS